MEHCPSGCTETTEMAEVSILQFCLELMQIGNAYITVTKFRLEHGHRRPGLHGRYLNAI
jgi:hypothetical protein